MWRLFYLLFPLSAWGEYFSFDHKNVSYGVIKTEAQKVKLHWLREDGQPFNNLENLRQYLEKSGPVEMLMNGGIFGTNHRPAGLWVEKGRELNPLNLKSGGGNFHFSSGVFAIAKGRAHILPAAQYAKRQLKAEYALQSGPLLIINGRINGKFRRDSPSHYRRNAVCTDRAGRVYFLMTIGARRDYPNLYHLAEAMQSLGCRQALHLDGSLSSWYVPGRFGTFHWRDFVGMVSVQ